MFSLKTFGKSAAAVIAVVEALTLRGVSQCPHLSKDRVQCQFIGTGLELQTHMGRCGHARSGKCNFKPKNSNLRGSKLTSASKPQTADPTPTAPTPTANDVVKDLVDKMDPANDQQPITKDEVMEHLKMNWKKTDNKMVLEWDNEHVQEAVKQILHISGEKIISENYQKVLDDDSKDAPAQQFANRFGVDKVGTGGFGRVYQYKSAYAVKSLYCSPRIGELFSEVVNCIAVEALRRKIQKEGTESERTVMENHVSKTLKIIIVGSDAVNKSFSVILISELLQKEANETNEETKRQITTAVDQAIKVLWDHNLYHNDIKRSNIMSDKFGNWKLIDFGLMRVKVKRDVNFKPNLHVNAASELICNVDETWDVENVEYRNQMLW